MSIDRFQYLLVMAACLVITLPLEFVFSARVYRRPQRLLLVLVPVAIVFVALDALAIIRDTWWFNPRYVTGWQLPFDVPLEELVFFAVIPLCALLTYESVRRILGRALHA